MTRIADFLVRARRGWLILFLILTAVSLILMPRVQINTDLTKYLPEDSQMSRGIAIMSGEFPDSGTDIGTVRVMVKGLDEQGKTWVLEKLQSVQGVVSVSEDGRTDGKTLFILMMKSDAGVSGINAALEGYDFICAKDEESHTVPVLIVMIVFAVVLGTMLLMSASWAEPVLFLGAIGIAIILNMGTNVLLESVSSVTFGLTAIMQLILSMDYSIILSNRYRQECEAGKESVTAMRDAIASSIPSVLSSALTTVVGLMALLFMRFRIGADLGLVMAKGVLLSLICAFTVLPALLLMSRKLIMKTSKKQPSLPTGKMARASDRHRRLLAAVFVLLFLAVFWGRTYAGISYDYPVENEVTAVFPPQSRIVLLYRNGDEEPVSDLVSGWERMEGVSQVNAWSNTLGRSYTAMELSEAFSGAGLGEEAVRMIFYHSFADRSGEKLTLEELAAFLSRSLEKEDSLLLQGLDDETRSLLEKVLPLCSREGVNTPLSASELSAMSGMDEETASSVLSVMGMESASITEILSLIRQPLVSLMLGEMAQRPEIALLERAVSAIQEEETFTVPQMEEMLASLDEPVDGNMISLLYAMVFSSSGCDPSWTMTPVELLETLSSDPYRGMLSSDQLAMLQDAKSQMDDGARSLVSSSWSRAVIDTGYVAGSDEIMSLTEELIRSGDEALRLEHYYIGTPVMAHEMKETFSEEFNRITLITAAAIFLVIMITFRSPLIPLILTLVIQGAVYMTMSVMGIVHYSMFYIALLIMQCVLMGATIDYAIVFTHDYRRRRREGDIAHALSGAYQSTVRTIMTSGLIMVVGAGALGFSYQDSTIGPICRIISAGGLSALVLILVFLPSLLAVTDRWTAGLKKPIRNKNSECE